MVRVHRPILTEEERSIRIRAVETAMLDISRNIKRGEKHGEVHNQRHSKAVCNGL